MVWPALRSRTATEQNRTAAGAYCRYPERSAVLLAACSLVCAAAHVLRLAAGPDLISCVHPDQDQSPFYLVSGDLHSTWCLVTVLLLYFFGMAAALWWVALAAGFYLAAGRKWSREAVSDVAGYFHAAAWALPAVQTAAVLALRRFSGDELTGLCYVDSAAAGSLVGFVLAPLGFYLVAGLVLVGAGFVAMFRIRADLLESSALVGSRQLEKLMLKVTNCAVFH